MPRGRERILDEGKQREVCALFGNEYGPEQSSAP